MRKTSLHFGLLAAVLLSASAAQAGYTSPVGGWSVGPISLGSGSPSYCSMKNKFDDGTILVLARDAAGASSIAVDVQKKILVPGKAYQVSFQVDQGVRRAYSAKAATAEVIIVQSGRDPEFYEAIASGNTLQAVIAGVATQSYDLQGTANGLSKLESCVARLAPSPGKPVVKASKEPAPPAVAEPVSPVAAAPLSVNSPVRQQLASTREQISRLKREQERTVAQLQRVQDRMEEDRQLREELARVRAENARLKKEQERAVSQLTVLRGEREAEALAKAELRAAESELNKLAAEQQALQQQLAMQQQQLGLTAEAEATPPSATVTPLAMPEREAPMIPLASTSDIPPEGTEFLPELSAQEQEISVLRHMGGNQPAARKPPVTSDMQPPQQLAALEPAPVPVPVPARPPESAAPPPQSAETSIPEPAAVPVPSVQAKSLGLPGREGVSQTLAQAGVTPDKPIVQDYEPTPENVSYSWQVKGLFGNATYQTWDRNAATFVEKYVAVTKSRCAGDFAANISQSDRIGDTEYVNVEIACVADQGDASAALVFHQKGDVVGVIAHEGLADQMQAAVRMRDAVSEVIVRRAQETALSN